MRFITFSTCSLISFLFSASLVAGQETQCSLTQNDVAEPIYNASCRIDVQGQRDFFVKGSFIYWQPIQENMTLGVVSTLRTLMIWSMANRCN